MFQANPQGLLALIAITACWGLAVVLLRVSMSGSVARKLALLLVIEGVALGSSDAILLLLRSPADLISQYPWFIDVLRTIHTLCDVAMLALYPPFLAVALQTKITRPFAGKRARIGLVLVALVLFLIAMLTPTYIGLSVLYSSLIVLFLLALLASIHAWYIATGIEHTRARIFVLAFGFRDICWGFLYSATLWEGWMGVAAPPEGQIAFRFLVYVLGTLVAVPLIAYGILRTQLFDIDLRIRWTIKQSTLAAAFVAIMFIISEAAARLLEAELGAVAGLIAAALVVFFLAPLQAFAERVASAAMPNTQNTPEYVTFRKMQVYEAAVAEAQLEDGISHKERALLVRLRDSLGISETDAVAIENELQSSTG